MAVRYHCCKIFCRLSFSFNISQTHEIIHDSIRKTQRKNIAEMCFDNVKHFLVLYVLNKKTRQCKVNEVLKLSKVSCRFSL